jgi:hypothetical protein
MLSNLAPNSQQFFEKIMSINARVTLLGMTLPAQIALVNVVLVRCIINDELIGLWVEF